MPHFLYNALYECVFYENKLILIPCTNGLQSIHTAYLNPIDFGGYAHFKNTKKNVKDLLKYIWKIDKSSSI